jgi:predicted Fe-Mo cluster-binding NifX family protein
MKIAISVTRPESSAVFDPRFGRAAAFVVVDTRTGDRCAIANPAAQMGSGAGIRAAEFLVRQGVEAVISGAFGPKRARYCMPRTYASTRQSREQLTI